MLGEVHENIGLLSTDLYYLFSVIYSPFLLFVSRTFPASPFFSRNLKVDWVLLGAHRHSGITDTEI